MWSVFSRMHLSWETPRWLHLNHPSANVQVESMLRFLCKRGPSNKQCQRQTSAVLNGIQSLRCSVTISLDHQHHVQWNRGCQDPFPHHAVDVPHGPHSLDQWQCLQSIKCTRKHASHSGTIPLSVPGEKKKWELSQLANPRTFQWQMKCVWSLLCLAWTKQTSNLLN